MSAALQIFDKVPGAARRSVGTISLASERLTVRDLIRKRVEQEVAAFNSAEEKLYTGLVQPEESERQLNGYKLKKRRPLDVEKQIRVALEAFASNGVLLLFDDRQVEDLDEEVTVTSKSSATFLRLVPLVGG